MARELQHQVRRRAEPGEARGIAVVKLGEPQRTPADRTGAEQWRRDRVLQLAGNCMCKGDRVTLLDAGSSMRVASGGTDSGTQVLVSGPAPAAPLPEAGSLVDLLHKAYESVRCIASDSRDAP